MPAKYFFLSIIYSRYPKQFLSEVISVFSIPRVIITPLILGSSSFLLNPGVGFLFVCLILPPFISSYVRHAHHKNIYTTLNASARIKFLAGKETTSPTLPQCFFMPLPVRCILIWLTYLPICLRGINKTKLISSSVTYFSRLHKIFIFLWMATLKTSKCLSIWNKNIEWRIYMASIKFLYNLKDILQIQFMTYLIYDISYSDLVYALCSYQSFNHIECVFQISCYF